MIVGLWREDRRWMQWEMFWCQVAIAALLCHLDQCHDCPAWYQYEECEALNLT